jgi:hypothetical protein
MLHVRSANLVEMAAGLPRASDRWDMGYQWRLLLGSGVVGGGLGSVPAGPL